MSRGGIIPAMGGRLLAMIAYVGGLALLLASASRWFARGVFVRGARFGVRALAGQMVRVGVKSAAIVMLVQLFIGVILALQMTPPLHPWGQDDKVAVIIGIAGFRMLGPIITAVVLSGFAGASIAAELGTMVVGEELEAMKSIALNPVRYLVVPRVVATLVMMVVLTVLADVMISLGGYLTARIVLTPLVWFGYWDRMRDQLQYSDLNTGLVMAAVFGLLVSLIACYEGLKVHSGAEGVGLATTRTVVNSIVAIICAACVFTVIFYVYQL